MNLAVLSESESDEAALRVLVDAVLERENAYESKPALRSRGWSAVLGALPAVLTHLYFQTNVDGLVVVVDGNSSPIHVTDNEHQGRQARQCRYCELSRMIQPIVSQLTQRTDRAPLRVACAVAAPSIEGWLLAGQDPHCTEAAWVRDLENGVRSREAINRLKRRLYGTDRPGIRFQTERAVEAAQRHAKKIDELEAAFLNGFGTLARQLRSWPIK
jgi:hypothetical protein